MRASEYLRIAQNEVGYIGKVSNKDLDDPTANTIGNYTKYARDIDQTSFLNGRKQAFAWCTTFQLWCAYQACGCNEEETLKHFKIGKLSAGVGYHKMYYANANKVGNEPKVGACVYFKDSSGQLAHVGIVKEINGNTFTTIEGNVSQKVVNKTYTLGNKYVDSFSYPDFDDEPEPPVEDWKTIAEWDGKEGKTYRLQEK